MKHRLYGSAAIGLVAMLALSGCAEKTASTDDASGAPTAGSNAVLAVSSTDDACTVAADTTVSGASTFSITNEGTQTTEFYLLAPDGLRVVAEKENITPGSTSELTVTLQPGDYFTACKPGMRGENVGETAFTVTGDAVELSDDEQALYDQVVTDYVNFVKNEVEQLQPKVDEFAQAYMDGDDDKARELFPNIRVHYERIEPITEALGVLDPRIDYREVDYLAEADLLKEDDATFTQWLGFHRIEKDLWPPEEGTIQPDRTDALAGWSPSSTEERQVIGQTLKDDVQVLYDTVHADDFIETQQIDIATVSNGASGLLEEIASSKVTGEEDWWSHTDLWDFQGNLEGARIAFDLVKPIAETKSDEGAELVKEIDEEFDKLQALLDQYGNLTDGYVFYDTVTSDQQKELVDQINATREPLSKLTGTVLGIE